MLLFISVNLLFVPQTEKVKLKPFTSTAIGFCASTSVSQETVKHITVERLFIISLLKTMLFLFNTFA